jgi:hypothetical protein
MRINRRHRLVIFGTGRQVKGLFALSLGFGLIGIVASSMVLAQAPGPELFAKEPHTPLELWDAVDYLLRTNQGKKAVPYIDRFIKSKPDDAALIAIRNRYGPGSILRLSDDAATRPFAQSMVEAMVSAARKYATRPEQVRQFISDLTKTPDEQDYAVRHLREAGPDAIPFLIEALARPELSADDRRLIVRNMGRLDRSVIPPLAAVLDSSDPILAADAATALGMIGDKEAIPFLTFPAAFSEAPPPVSTAAKASIASVTGQPFLAQPHTSVQVLTDAAWRYHRHQFEFPENPVNIWVWDNERRVPSSRQVSRTEAEGILGLRLVQQALRLDPGNHEAQVAQISLTLEKAIERIGLGSFPTKDAATFNAAKASGSSILSDVLKTAIVDGKAQLGAITATALGQVIDRAALTATGRPHPLVDALYARERDVQFAAAKALITLAPISPFPGSSRVVPTLARFVMNQALPRAVVIDGNPNRGSQLAGLLITLGYDSELEVSGAKGFRAATESADVELILISYDLFRSGWGLNDTLANLGADSRTAAIPVFIYGPLDVQYKRPNLEHDYPGIKFLVQPVSPDMLLRQFKALPPVPSETVRVSYAREAATLLARIATENKGPLVTDLTAVEPTLALALNEAQIAPAAATTLREVPDPDAQRSLADVVLDPSRAPSIRKQSASELVHSIQRFGRLITASQEARLNTVIREESDPEVRASLLSILRALIATPPLRSPKYPTLAVPGESTSPVQPRPEASITHPQPGVNR